jgi:DNA polymerase-1
MYMAEPGKALFNIDYSQAEARVVAYLARCEGLIELFEDPTRDVHKENAARFYKISVEEVDGKKRYVAKRIIHASNYGMGPNKCARVINNDYRDTGIRVTFQEARLGQEAYFFTYPEIQNVFWHEIREELFRSLILTTPFGRKRIFYGKWSDKFLDEAYSFIPQSTVGDMTNRAMVRVYKQCPEAELFINGHDSLVGQCDIDKVAEVTKKIQSLMAIPVVIHGRELIIPTDVEVGLNWGEQSDDNPDGLRSLAKWLS